MYNHTLNKLSQLNPLNTATHPFYLSDSSPEATNFLLNKAATDLTIAPSPAKFNGQILPTNFFKGEKLTTCFQTGEKCQKEMIFQQLLK